MKLSIVVSALLAASVISAPREAAARGPFGLGIVLGDPSGLSGKLFVSRQHAIDAALAFSLVDDVLYVHADYLFHASSLSVRSLSGHRFLPYVGVGGFIGVRDNDHGRDDDSTGAMGVRVPLGIAWEPRVPIDVFLEVVPTMRLIPETNGGLDAGLGIRYFF
ncbi:MAG: hypothetical protein ACOYM9_21275 [Bradymonadia bacterium]|jgi:hypothetical protein